MTKKKIAVINCFDSFKTRERLIAEVCVENNYEVIVVNSDFSHYEKRKIIQDTYDLPNTTFLSVNTIPYKKNISFSRLISHYYFSKSVYRQICNIRPNAIYCIIPPNSLVKKISLFKKRNPKTKLIFDINDMWPESFPFKNTFATPFLNMWRKIRNKNIVHSNMIITECNLFKEELKRQNIKKEIKVVYYPDSKEKCMKKEYEIKDEINLCYIGSINNIIDIDFIIKLLNAIKSMKNIYLHIIGGGEKETILINKLNENQIQFHYYGKIYDEMEICKIIEKCQYGLNIMLETVFVGLTMKSVKYLKYGLPIINNIYGDTNDAINLYDLGFNVNKSNINTISTRIVETKPDEYLAKRENVLNFYNKYLSYESVKKAVNESIREVLL